MVATTANGMAKIVHQLCDERDRLRAELAMKERELEGQTLLYQDAVNDNAAKDARIAELEEWGDGLRESLGTTISTMEEERARSERAEEEAHYANGVADLAMKHRNSAEAEAKAVREALEPFAQQADGRDHWPDNQVFTLNVTMRTLRKASAALAPSSVDEKLK